MPGPRAIPRESDPKRYATYERPRCPVCGSVRIRSYKTLPSAGDDSLSRYTQCQSVDCGARFVLVLE